MLLYNENIRIYTYIYKNLKTKKQKYLKLHSEHVKLIVFNIGSAT